MDNFANNSDEALAAFDYAKKGNLKGLTRLLKRTKNFNLRNEKETTLLMRCAFYNHVDCVQYLICAGADVHATNLSKDTALMLACRRNRDARGVIELLATSGADVNYRGSAGTTALIEAASHNHILNVEALIRLGANINIATERDETALSYAIVWHYNKLAELLIKSGADVKWKNRNEWTYLRWAAFEKNRRLVNLLLKSGANPSELE